MDGIHTAASTIAATSAAQARSAVAVSGESAGQAAKRFEALFATMLVKEMRRTLPEGFFGAGADGDVYGGWLDQSVGDSLAQRDALHIEETLRLSLERKAQAVEVAP
jgi:Rod binding domain-containing protein